uniref:sulfotransferase n=1 Tax=uncultured Erythrobacter sp. TaxID=263913 RepID=UPI002613588B|nr:sulfotransferase [uncultured Erythrobacter sp.]
MAGEYLCNLVIPGAAKSGTTSLHEYLSLHPQIAMSSNKEPHYFCREDFYAQGPEFHNGLFEEASQIRYYGESSTGYLPSPLAIENIRRDLKDPKIIMVLRHPVERSFSHYRWRFRLGLEKRTFLQAMQDDGYGYVPQQPDNFGYKAYLEFSQYAKTCPAWEDVFGSANCLILRFADLTKNRASVLGRCFDFLGLPRIELGLDDAPHNKTDDVIRRAAPTPNPLTRLVPKAVKQAALYQSLKQNVLRASTPTPPKRMTSEERQFAENALGQDIDWFNARFASAPELADE